ncbi:MAG: DMT family transporter [Chloroflexota bacterium]
MGKGGRDQGIQAALASALFLGLAPIFGRQAIGDFGFSPLAVVALRTSLAAILLLVIFALFKRPFLYIYPAGLMGCTLAGAINGLGSILYYQSFQYLSASVGQLLYSLYPIFVALWLTLDGEHPGRLTIVRIILATGAAALLTLGHDTGISRIGALMMLGAAALYGLHLPINQRVLYDVPAPTVTLYTLLAMSAVVVPAYFIFNRQFPDNPVLWPVAGLTLVTFLSRLTLFMGVKHLGGMQTALLGLAELLVTLTLGYFWLGEKLTPLQWIGAGLLSVTLLLVHFEKGHKPSKSSRGGWLKWLRPPGLPTDLWGRYD